MKTIVPIIAILGLALGVYALDPMRHAGPALRPAALGESMAGAPAFLGDWRLDGPHTDMPRAFDTFREVHDRTVRYVLGNDMAYVRVAIALDRRDLRAYMPAHAMRRVGWSPSPADVHDGLERCVHQRDTGLLEERVSVESAYVLPGQWGHDAGLIDRASPVGPGWPGPGAVVQLVLTNPEAGADALRRHVRDLADALAHQMQVGVEP